MLRKTLLLLLLWWTPQYSGSRPSALVRPSVAVHLHTAFHSIPNPIFTFVYLPTNCQVIIFICVSFLISDFTPSVVVDDDGSATTTSAIDARSRATVALVAEQVTRLLAQR